MRKQETGNSYIRSVNRVIDYIHGHYSEKLTLEALAGVGCFSPWHFHRIFREITGETHQEFINRVRLDNAMNLMSENMPCGDAAIAVGFSSAAHFSKTFKVKYGLSPRQFIRKSIDKTEPCISAGPVSLNQDYLKHGRADSTEFSVQDFSGCRIAYVRHIGNYDFRIGYAWRKLMGWARRNGIVGTDMMRISGSYDNPDIGTSGRLIYDACITIPDDLPDSSEEAVSFRTIPGGRYAVFRFSGRIAQLASFYDSAYRKLINGTKLKFRDERNFRIHLESPKDHIRGKLRNDLYIPVA